MKEKDINQTRDPASASPAPGTRAGMSLPDESAIARRWLESAGQRYGASAGGASHETLIEEAAQGFRDFASVVNAAAADGREAPMDEIVRVARAFSRPARTRGRTADDFAATIQALGPALADIVEPIRRAHLPDVDREVARMISAVAGVLIEEEIRERRELAGTIDIFTRTLAHELKNPIGAAEGGAQMILDDAIAADPARRRRFAELIVRNLRRAGELVNDLRLIIAARRGEEAESRPQAFAAIVSDVIHEVRGGAAQRGVKITVADPLPDLVVDGARISLVMMNLVWNAIKYADTAKGERWVRLGARQSVGDGWYCFVADNGLGIPNDHQKLVFERFHRAHPHVATGTGLGLTITREAIEQLGGRIWLESSEGAGTTFYFTLPPAETEAPSDRPTERDERRRS